MSLSFSQTLAGHRLQLQRSAPEILQLNVGKMCNLACQHCHVNAGPWRKERMSREVLERILAWLEPTDISTVDLTGGAPEMLEDFRWLVQRLRKGEKARKVIDRCNLTILLEPGYRELPAFLAEHQVEIVASMPCYSPDNVNAQRGEGVFDASIEGLRALNAVGYGSAPALDLHLVYNPLGATLPPDQAELEGDYKQELEAHFGIRFNRLFTITNMPIARFESYLKQNGKLEEYYALLLESFNPAAVDGLMCRNTISVDHEGRVFDCDFNQMLNLPMGGQSPRFLWDLPPEPAMQAIPIATGRHCFGCTAGAGSSCQGALEVR